MPLGTSSSGWGGRALITHLQPAPASSGDRGERSPQANPTTAERRLQFLGIPASLRRCARSYRVLPQGQIFLFQATNPQTSPLKARLSSASRHPPPYPTTTPVNRRSYPLFSCPLLPFSLLHFIPHFTLPRGLRILSAPAAPHSI